MRLRLRDKVDVTEVAVDLNVLRIERVSLGRNRDSIWAARRNVLKHIITKRAGRRYHYVPELVVDRNACLPYRQSTRSKYAAANRETRCGRPGCLDLDRDRRTGLKESD